MAHSEAREWKWRWNWRMEWVASTLHTTSEHGVSSITTADARTSAASSRLNWHPRRFKWTCPFCWKMKSGFCACAITFRTQSNISYCHNPPPQYANKPWTLSDGITKQNWKGGHPTAPWTFDYICSHEVNFCAHYLSQHCLVTLSHIFLYFSHYTMALSFSF
jgi:hypothetical protein